MNNEKAIELLNKLQEDVDMWDRDDSEISKLADETIEALIYAINIIEASDIVGTLNINNKKYLIAGTK